MSPLSEHLVAYAHALQAHQTSPTEGSQAAVEALATELARMGVSGLPFEASPSFRPGDRVKIVQSCFGELIGLQFDVVEISPSGCVIFETKSARNTVRHHLPPKNLKLVESRADRAERNPRSMTPHGGELSEYNQIVQDLKDSDPYGISDWLKANRPPNGVCGDFESILKGPKTLRKSTPASSGTGTVFKVGNHVRVAWAPETGPYAGLKGQEGKIFEGPDKEGNVKVDFMWGLLPSSWLVPVYKPGDRISIKLGCAWRQAVVSNGGHCKVVEEGPTRIRELAEHEARPEVPLTVGTQVRVMRGPHKCKRAVVTWLDPLRVKAQGVEFRVASHWLYVE